MVHFAARGLMAVEGKPDARPSLTPPLQTGANTNGTSAPAIIHTALPEVERALQLMLSAPFGAGDAERDPSARFAETLDRSVHYWLSRWTMGLSPLTLSEAYADWALHLSIAPGKQMQLAHKGVRKNVRLARHMARQLADGGKCKEPCIEPLPQDKRFSAPEWQSWPFNVTYQSFLLNQQWWHNAMTGVRGVSPHHEAVADFATRQVLDVFSPANFVWTNPVVLQKTQAEAGQNLVRGWWNLIEDWERVINGRSPVGAEQFEVGKNLALTPGKVIYRNRLIELIQYTPTTSIVRPEPVLIVPAWIMKYYILDLTPEKSLVKHLVDQGFTVFIISWLNPEAEDRDLSFDDYRRLGLMSALDVVGRIVPHQKVHGVGYCLGGTLLATGAAAMARVGDDRFASLSFLASEADFREAGELTLFMDDSQLAMTEDVMWEQGYLDAAQMSGAFQMIRSNDLIWSRVIHDYLMGERRPLFDLMAWNADTTRMPYKMHSEYLRRFFHNNDLAEGRYEVDGHPIALDDIEVPVCAVAAETDHVAPWRSVYKFNLSLDTEVTFLLASGGHNSGIVPDPKRAAPHYRVATRLEHDHYVDPETWERTIEVRDGSWWQAWSDWLGARSGPPISPPEMGAPKLGLPPGADAPGTYVRRR